MKQLWVVATLCVVAAGSAQAAEKMVVWDGKIRGVEVDENYVTSHPEQLGLQTVVAGDLRPAVRNLEGRVSNLEARPENTAPRADRETLEGKGGKKMTAVWVIGGVIAALVAAIMIGMWCGFFRPQNGSARSARPIRETREAMSAPTPPAPTGNSRGQGGAIHYDDAGRVIGWERWEFPAHPVQGTSAGRQEPEAAPQIPPPPPP